MAKIKFNLGWNCCDKWVEKEAGNRVAVYFREQRLSYSELRKISNRIGNALLGLNVSPQKRFIVRLPNIPESYATILAGLKIGAVPVPTVTFFREKELEWVLNSSEASLVVTQSDLAEPIIALRDRCPYLTHVACIDESIDGTVVFRPLIDGASSELRCCETSLDDPAFVLYTSGTTGNPTGIAHGHRAFNIARSNPNGRYVMDLKPSDIVFQPQEVAFSYSFGCGFLSPLDAGASIVAVPGRITAERAFEILDKYAVTIFCTVPTMYRTMLTLEDAENKYDLSHLRRCISAGEPLSLDTFHAWKSRFGVEIIDHIGQAEIHMFCGNTPEIGIKPGSLGKPLPEYHVTILDNKGNECPPRTAGHLVIRDDNPGLFYEYLKMPDKWKESHRNGWYYTGDMACKDEDGYVWYISRTDDLIKSRAYLISPKEIEDVLLEHEAVLEAGVVGVPDEAIGHQIKAFIVLREGYSPSEEMAEKLRDHVRKRIAPYKTPRQIEFLRELPRTATGKIKREALRAAN